HPALRKELKDILEIQLEDTVKARILDAELKNEYVAHAKKNPVRSQLKIYQYLFRKKTY
ncbi:MAG: polyphosphate kinase 1, partial [Bacteroidota bacterium]